eukprot:GFUD01030349.1.p1 GENE.GFUD01030349.1~~GFUD01030349.1.p1  ORF type:complete len:638 (+),score=191.26 GFUD01030349.1:71-1915(+)
MFIVACIFCHGQVVSEKNVEELEVKYENHLMDWHNIAIRTERKLAMSRSRGEDLLDKFNQHKEETSLSRELSDKIEIAMENAPRAVEQQLTIENEDYLIRSMVIENEGSVHEETVTNTDITKEVDDKASVDDNEHIVGEKVDYEESENIEVPGKECEDSSKSASANLSLNEHELDIDTFKKVNHVDDLKELVSCESHVTNQATFVIGDHISDGSQDSRNSLSDECSVSASEGVKVIRLKNNVIENLAGQGQEADMSVPWYEWGHHVCVVCDRTVFLGSVERHLQLNHSLSLVRYQEQYKLPEGALFIPPYECRVCGVAVSHTHKKIMAHVQLHNMDMASYDCQYDSVKRGEGESDQIKSEVENKEVFNVGEDQTNEDGGGTSKQLDVALIRPKTFTISNKMFRKKNKKDESLLCSLPVKNVQSSSAELSQLTTNAPLYKAELNSSQQALALPDGSSSVPARKRRCSASDTEPTGQLPWYDSAWHQCLECGKVTTRGKFFTSHVKVHSMTKKQYLAKFPADKVDNLPNWTCGVCSKKISWAAKSIVTHLARVHSMSKDQYASAYINIGQEKIEDWGEDNPLCDSEEIVLEGKPQIQRLDTTQDITDALGIIGVEV